MANKNEDKVSRFRTIWKIYEPAAKAISAGKPVKYEDRFEMGEAIMSYFDHRLSDLCAFQVEKLITVSGGAQVGSEVERHIVNHPRIPTLFSLKWYLGLTKQGWADYREKPEFADLMSAAEEWIREEKIAGAAVGIYKENLISRLEGLADKQEKTVDHNIHFDKEAAKQDVLARMASELGLDDKGEASVH